MVIPLLGLATAVLLQLPPASFGWKVPASARLTVFQGKESTLERVNATEPLTCTDSSAIAVRQTVAIPATSYKVESFWCKDRETSFVGSRATLNIRIRRSGEKEAWSLDSAEGVIGLGFKNLPEEWAEADSGSLTSKLAPQPFLGSIGVPGIVVVQFLSQPVYTAGGGHIWTFEQHLLDLRGPEPKHLALGVWSRVSNLRCREESADGSAYGCNWDKVRGDFVCFEKRQNGQRTLTLSDGKRLPQRLSDATISLDTASPGSLVYVRQIGLGRLVARISATRAIVIAQTPHLVFREPKGWRASEADFDDKALESTDAATASIVELHGWGKGRTFDVVRGGVQRVIRYDAEPSPTMTDVVVASPHVDLGGACEQTVVDEVLTVRPSDASALLIESQPAFRSDGFLDSAGDAAKRLCPETVGLKDWGRNASDDRSGKCDRPMAPFVSRLRPGRPDLLWADDATTVDRTAVSLRGRGQGTVVLLEGGLSDEQWRRVALGISYGNELEIMRVVASENDAENTAAIRNGLTAISAKTWTLVAVHARQPKTETGAFHSGTPREVRAVGPAKTAPVAEDELEQVCLALIETARSQRWIPPDGLAGGKRKPC